MIRIGPDELDLLRFERLVEEAQQATPELAARRLREALDLWRGPPLADLADESFAQAEILRLEEVHLVCVERRIAADLELGRHAELVGELEVLVHDHPLREGLCAQLMLALYRSGRQAEALTVYRETRSLLVDELGIEPSPVLRELEQAILRQEPDLAPQGETTAPQHRAIMVVAGDPSRFDQLLAIAEPLARRPVRELILVRLFGDEGELTAVNAELAEKRHMLADRGISSRVAAYTTAEPGSDAARLATEHDVDLVLVDSSSGLPENGHPDRDLGVILEQVPCDVAVLMGAGDLGTGPVVTPFGGVEHDWSAIELAAWLALSLGTTLRLLGTEANTTTRPARCQQAPSARFDARAAGGRDRHRARPRSPRRGRRPRAAHDARLLVIGLSDRWPSEGIGSVRLAVAARAGIPTLFVRRGLRPSGVAPNRTVTRFTWTLASQHAESRPDAPST